MAMPAGRNATAKSMVTDTAAVVASLRNRYTCAVLASCSTPRRPNATNSSAPAMSKPRTSPSRSRTVHDPGRDGPYGRRDSLPGRRIREHLDPGRLRGLGKRPGFTGYVGLGDVPFDGVGDHRPGPLGHRHTLLRESFKYLLACRARDPADDAGEGVLDLGRSRGPYRRARQQLDLSRLEYRWLRQRRHTHRRTGQARQMLRVVLRDHDRSVVLAAFETPFGLAAALEPRPLHEIRGRGVR